MHLPNYIKITLRKVVGSAWTSAFPSLIAHNPSINMWAIRKASIRIKSQLFKSASFCAAKFETRNSSYKAHAPNRLPLLNKISFRTYGTQSSSIEKHNFSSQSNGEKNDEFEDCVYAIDVGKVKNMEHESNNELISEDDLSETEVVDNEIAVEGIAKNNQQGSRAPLGMFKAIVDSSSMSTWKALDRWLEEGNRLNKLDITQAMFELRRRRMYGKALQLLEWLESQKNFKPKERTYASHIDLVAKTRGLQKAENFIERIPEPFRGELVYRTLLANCVLNTNTKKAEQTFNKMKDLNFPTTAFACNQLLLLYKRTDKKKIADVLLLMEKENVKPSLFTYRVLIETKGQSNDISGIEHILNTMKADGIEPDSRFLAALARQYVYANQKGKAYMVLKELEGSNLNENRRICAVLLPIYALLESEDDVKRVWDTCRSDPRLDQCTNAIEAWGKLKKVEEAEKVFDEMSKRWKKLSAVHYTSMLNVYANNKMLSKAKHILQQMHDNGCRIGPLTWDAVVKLYLELGEIEKADSILKRASEQRQTKPLFMTYMMILDEYAKRGDVHNAEKIFHRMRRNGYVSRLKQYNSLLQAYINAKVPAYGFSERLKADNMFPSRTLIAQLAEADPFKKTLASELLD